MNRNVEVKVKVEDPAAVLARIPSLGADDRGVIRQTDTYFKGAAEGLRLKLREQDPGPAELIAYERPTEAGLRTSRYMVVPESRPAELKRALELALGIRSVVVKTRRLLLAGRTRIHLDEVEGLGSFLELEVVLGAAEAEEAGRVEAKRILAALGLANAPRIAGSYAEL
jgi:predicted adenylyl cyclase CyaB